MTKNEEDLLIAAGLDAWLPFKRELNELEKLFENNNFFGVNRIDVGTIIIYQPHYNTIIYPPIVEIKNAQNE